MLRFSVAGSPLSTPKPGGTLEGLRRASALGINGMEIEWVQNVPTNVDHLRNVKAAAEELDIHLTAHAPYFVNFNAVEDEKRIASIGRVSRALAMAEIAGVRSVCVHAAFNLGKPEDAVYDNVARCVDAILSKKKLFPHVNLALETMGKPTQFGTLKEVLKVSKEFDVYPCVDFAHLHARYQGAVNTPKEWNDILDHYADALGAQSLKQMHLHYSGIAFGPGGERKHLPLEESDADWRGLLGVLKKRRVGGVLVCESPVMERDVELLRTTFESL